MAEVLARSFNRFRPTSPLTVVTDQPDNALLKNFDKILLYRSEFGSGLSQKLHLDQYTPYSETIFIDSDGLFYKDPEALWGLYSGFDEFAVRGFRYRGVEDGVPGLREPKETFNELKIKRAPFLNSGILYFRDGARKEKLFATARDIAARAPALGLLPFDGHEFNDENVFALAMEVCGIDILPWDNGTAMDMYSEVKNDQSLNITVPCARFTTYGRPVDPIFVHYCAGAQFSITYVREALRIKAITSKRFKLFITWVDFIAPLVVFAKNGKRKSLKLITIVLIAFGKIPCINRK